MNTLDREIHGLMQRVSERVILPRYQNLTSEEIDQKAADDFVTVADHEAEEMLSGGLRAIDNSLAIVAEEAAHADPTILENLSEDCWIIDPLDGTHNFANGQPPFGIIIARASGGVCQSGWILDCLSGRFCHTSRNQGAFIDGERISSRSTGCAVPIAAISRLFLDQDQLAIIDAKIAPHYHLVDIPRCAAEQYPRLALGENDVSTFHRTLAWDHAAGVLWLNEAGGKATRLDGSDYRVDENEKPGLIGVSSPAIWDKFVQRLLN